MSRLGTSAALLLAAALAIPTARAAAADPFLGAPAVGQCSDMSRAELDQPAYAEAAVDCAGPHTAEVLAVTQLPNGLAYDSPDVVELALETCYPAQRKALRTTVRGARLTAYAIGWFGPTPEQQDAGARWLRCDLVLLAGSELAPLPGKLAVGRFPFRKSVSRCLAGRDFLVTTCSREHTHRATAALRVRAERYPRVKAWKRIGTERCRRETTSRTFRFSWPSKVDWKVGDRTLVCYTQTRR